MVKSTLRKCRVCRTKVIPEEVCWVKLKEHSYPVCPACYLDIQRCNAPAGAVLSGEGVWEQYQLPF